MTVLDESVPALKAEVASLRRSNRILLVAILASWLIAPVGGSCLLIAGLGLLGGALETAEQQQAEP